MWERTFSDSFRLQTGEDSEMTGPTQAEGEETDNRLTEERESRARQLPRSLSGGLRQNRIRRFNATRQDRHPAIEG